MSNLNHPKFRGRVDVAAGGLRIDGVPVTASAADLNENTSSASFAAVVAAAGTTQGTGTVLTARKNAITGADGTKGVVLPTASAGEEVVVINTDTTSALKVYPASGAAVNSLSANAAYTLAAGTVGIFECSSATQWYVAAVVPVKASAAEVTTGTDDAKFATAKAIKDAGIVATPVKASGAEINTGTDDAKFATAKAITDSKVAQGVAAGYRLARSAAPVALDGSNPTSVAHGLTTCVAAFVQLVGSAAPGDSTSVLSCVINGANIDVYGWKHTTGGAAGNPTLIASTGTESFNWFAIGT